MGRCSTDWSARKPALHVLLTERNNNSISESSKSRREKTCILKLSLCSLVENVQIFKFYCVQHQSKKIKQPPNHALCILQTHHCGPTEYYGELGGYYCGKNVSTTWSTSKHTIMMVSGMPLLSNSQSSARNFSALELPKSFLWHPSDDYAKESRKGG